MYNIPICKIYSANCATFVSTFISIILIFNLKIMTSGKKVALIVGIVAVVGIGTYLGVKAYKKKRRTSGNAQKNNRKINIV